MPYLKVSILSKMPVFWFADEYPELNHNETMELAQDIEKNGQYNPILIWEEKILDGRNRLKALQETNLEEALVEYFDGSEEDAINKTHSLNIMRRHLEKYQIAIIAEKKLEWVEQETARRKTELAKQQQDPETGKFRPLVEDSSTNGKRSRDVVAAEFNVNSKYIQNARRLRLNAPDLHAEVQKGLKNMDKAINELKARSVAVEKKEHALETGAYDLYQKYIKRELALDEAYSALTNRQAEAARKKRENSNEALELITMFSQVSEERLREFNIKVPKLITIEQVNKAIDSMDSVLTRMSTTRASLVQLRELKLREASE